MSLNKPLNIPELSLVVLIGTSGAGKSTFARKHFLPTEIVSSDFCRGLVSDDENNQAASADAFEVLHHIAGVRLRAGKLTVVDATNVKAEDRAELIRLARHWHVVPCAIVLNLPEKVCQERNENRSDRNFGNHVIRQQKEALRRNLRYLEKEGFRVVHILGSEQEVDDAEIKRQPLWNNLKHEKGPFDIVGDIHGCFDELCILLEKLGYTINKNDFTVTPPAGRKAVFLGDLVDRGPATPQVLKLIMNMVHQGAALCVAGNHDDKLLRKLNGKEVKIAHGLAESLSQLEAETDSFKEEARLFLAKLIGHYVLDEGRLVVAHAGMKEAFQGRASTPVKKFALYGETTGEIDEYGLPVRYNWAGEYRGRAMVVYGHTPVPQSQWLNNTINIDNGCVFGGKLTALRYPEKELVSVDAHKEYYAPAKPLNLPLSQANGQLIQDHGEWPSIEDVAGKRIINTEHFQSITIRAENSAAALEVMSRFAIDPRALIYLPPTMSPCETSRLEGYLEHPREALEYYQGEGVSQVICQEKHMGSRTCVLLTRDDGAKFGLNTGGACYTRTGRRFFNDDKLEKQFIDELRSAMEKAELWRELNSDWVLLDCELMPWSAKAQELLKQQYAAVGRASAVASAAATEALSAPRLRDNEKAAALLERYGERRLQSEKFIESYRRYSRRAETLTDYKLAPFHILASAGQVHEKSHLWHMEIAGRLAEHSSLVIATKFKVVDFNQTDSFDQAVEWWQDYVAVPGPGGEGMVVKPLDFTVRNGRHLVQPAVKCRGPEYLRIIYGPEYDTPKNLERLRKRALGAKRSLALREFALGLEGLHRFVRDEGLYRVHECVFAVLALESEPVDPRL